jgi:predicted ATP-grasp superfamily ATP-dependent carboligase
MVCAFQGWNDAGDSASTAVAFMATALGGRRFARIDSEQFYDYQANRPAVSYTETGEREIEWPTVEVFEVRAPRATRDLVLVQGVEPSLRWRSFSQHLVDLAEALGVQVVVSLGALLGDVPHTLPVSMVGYASDPSLIQRLGMKTSTYEGPTGIVGVLHGACVEAGLPSASIWAGVPHYVAAAASPKAALALVRRVEGLVGVAVDVTELEAASADYERQVGIAVQSDPDVAAFVERLEAAAAEEQEENGEDVPSGDVIAREFQRFLRQRGPEGQLGLDGPLSLGDQLGLGGQSNTEGEQIPDDQPDTGDQQDVGDQHGSGGKKGPEDRSPTGEQRDVDEQDDAEGKNDAEEKKGDPA